MTRFAGSPKVAAFLSSSPDYGLTGQQGLATNTELPMLIQDERMQSCYIKKRKQQQTLKQRNMEHKQVLMLQVQMPRQQ